MAGQCLTMWCPRYREIIYNTTLCPDSSITPLIPYNAARQSIDADVALSSHMSSSPCGPTPVLSEQMGHVPNSGDIFSPATLPTFRSFDRNSFLDSQAPFTPSSNEGLDGHKEQQNPQVRGWIDCSRPVPEKGAKETYSPACISCYNSFPCYRGSSDECCMACDGKNKYCRGIIKLPELIINREWHKDALTNLKSKCHSLHAVVDCDPVFSLDIYVNSVSKKEMCVINLEGLNDNLPLPDEQSKLERVLDLVFPADQEALLSISYEASRPDQADIAVELLLTSTRRFVACLTLLRTPVLCTFDELLWKHPLAPYVMLEFLRELSHKACDLFQQISSKVNKFANSKHQKKTFTKAKGSIAFNMGVIHTSIESFALGRSNWAESHFIPESLYDLTPEVLGQLQWLGRGFNQTRFEQGTRSSRIEHTGIHIAFPPHQDSRLLPRGSSNHGHSFVDVIGSRMPSNFGTLGSKPPVGVAQPIAPALQPQSQKDEIAADLEHDAELDLGLCETTQAEQYTLGCDTKCVDTPSTTSPLDDFLTPKYSKDSETEVIPLPPEARLKTEQHIGQLESQCEIIDTAIRELQDRKANLNRTIKAYKDSLDPEARQTSTKLTFTEMDIIPEDTSPANGEGEEYGARSSASPSCSGKTTLVEHNDDLDKRVGSNDNLSSYDLMDTTTSDTEAGTSTFTRDVASQPLGAHQPQLSKRTNQQSDTNSPSKRKRLSLFSSKRPLFTPVVPQTADSLETKAEHTEKAETPITNHRLSKNRLSQLLHHKQQPPRDPEEGLKVINSSRPQTYPLASLWRRSVVLSVKTITEAFESLRVAANPATSS